MSRATCFALLAFWRDEIGLARCDAPNSVNDAVNGCNRCRRARVPQVTMIHVNAVKALLGPCLEGEPADQAANVESCLYRLYGGLSAGQQYGLRQALLRFFQDKRIKVSIFLQARGGWE